jgi:hypothetical protein
MISNILRIIFNLILLYNFTRKSRTTHFGNYCPKHWHLFRNEGLYMQCTKVIQKFPDWIDNEMNNKNKHSLRSNTKDYGAKIH